MSILSQNGFSDGVVVVVVIGMKLFFRSIQDVIIEVRIHILKLSNIDTLVHNCTLCCVMIMMF